MDADKIKSFFVHHVEKMILVVVIAGAAYLMYSGTSLPDFRETQDPGQLEAKAQRVRSEIDLDHTEEVMKERIPTFDIVKETVRVDSPVDYTDYAPPRTWSGKSPNSIVRRIDPDLLAPEAVIVKPIVTAIAKRGSQSDPAAYALASLEPAEPVEKIEKPKKRERRSRRGNNMMMDEYGGGGGGMEEMMEMEMSMEMDMMADMGGMMGGGTDGAGGPSRRFNAKYDFGMRPNTTEDKANPEPTIGWFIAGTAVVPHKKLHESYRLAFQDADQYDARRDSPVYYDIEVERADVTDKSVDQLAEEDWQKVWTRTLYTKLAARAWSGFAPEIVPSDYRDDALTMWIPPVLLDDYRSFSLHPLIPMLSKSDLKRAAMEDNDEEVEMEEFRMDADEDDTVLVAPGQSSSSMMMGGMDDYGDMGDDYGGEMDGMMAGMGMSMFGRGGLEVDPVDYKLIRFYDFAGYKMSPKFGRKYVYRIRYAVNDPNFPYTSSLQPKVSSLAPDVAQRVQALMADALKTETRKFRRWSEWSQPTEPTSLPSLEQYFAGPVDPGTVNTWSVQGKDVQYARDAPKAKLVASQYDLSTGARIPMQLEITEGTVLSHKAETADVVDPITLEVKKMPDAELVSGTTVVDLDGGMPLRITDDLKTPGMMLIFDQMGQLKVSTEVGDQEPYRVYSYADERGE